MRLNPSNFYHEPISYTESQCSQRKLDELLHLYLDRPRVRGRRSIHLPSLPSRRTRNLSPTNLDILTETNLDITATAVEMATRTDMSSKKAVRLKLSNRKALSKPNAKLKSKSSRSPPDYSNS